MKIGKNKFVSLSYQLFLNEANGELVEETSSENPLQFVFGTGKMLQMFEQNLEGLKSGDAFSFELKATDGYGEINKDAIVDLPKNLFEVDGKIDESILTMGNSVPMQDAHGNRLNGIVLDVTDETVKMDFNHPLAGDDLYFSGSVLDVREASEADLAGSCGDGGCSSEGGCGGNCSC